MATFLVSHPDPQFSGEIVGIAFADGAATVDTEQAGGHAAYAYFQRAGYPLSRTEEQAVDSGPFDPGTHSVPEVLAHLATADADEQARVRAAEAAGKNRTTILNGAPVEADQQGAQS